MLEIFPLKALHDNYIWVICNSDNNCVTVVDPGDAKPVIDYLEQNNQKLSAILVTHHHWDHTNGIPELVKKYNVPVIGPTGSPVHEGQSIDLPDQNLRLQVLEIPGHTLDHVAYYNDDILFTGDTLFSAGCGRVFEGTYEQMFASLDKLKALPKNLKVYCGHEYTVKNLKFTLTVEPDNAAVKKRLQECEKLEIQGLPTLPSTMEIELATNPFLRAHDLPKFIEYRELKDRY